MWHVYILSCVDKTLYTGITVDLARRLEEHNSSKLGAKYTRARRPVKIVYSKKFRNRSTAAKVESRIKKLAREEKLKLIENKSHAKV
jgi:putative endonuclease